MGHLSILMLIKVQYKYFHQFINFKVYNTESNNKFLKFLERYKSRFELMAYRFVVNPLTHYTTLLGDNFWK